MGNNVYDFFNTELSLVYDDNLGKINFCFLANNDVIAEYELVLTNKDYPDFKFIHRKGDNLVYITYGRKTEKFEDFLYDCTPKIWFADGSSLEGNKYIEIKENIEPYGVQRIISWDWSGVNLRAEAQDVEPKITDSIQFHCIQRLKQLDYDIIYDDDYSGEIADVVAIKKMDDIIIFELYHLKFAKNGKPASDIKDLYEVCGQAQKSYHWKHKSNKELFDHMLKRLTKNYKGKSCSRLEQGTENDLIDLLRMVKKHFPLELKVFIVQPGISPRLVSQDQLTLLAVTESHLMKQANIPLIVIGSK